MTYEEFLTRHKPVQNHITQPSAFDGMMFETFGEELDFVRSQRASNKVWTIIEGDDSTWLVSGYHYVNRLGYIVTEVAVGPDETIEIDLYED